ncbi:membrane protein [Mycobacterium phage ScoobyDoobyDoo]|nr:membrane protein [Mycobacterium phage ScoobyDoobyDoo]
MGYLLLAALVYGCCFGVFSQLINQIQETQRP